MTNRPFLKILFFAIILLIYFLPSSTNASENHIPVVLATDDKFAPYTKVTLYSILKNSNTDTFYEVFVLVPENFDKKFIKKISTLKERYNCEINFIKVSSNALNLLPSDGSEAVYYRLLIADLLPNCDKCIYLDSDTIVLADLSELYTTDVGKYYVAGVKDIPSISAYKEVYWPSAPQEFDRIIDRLDFSNYINSGVLVMNLRLIREHRLIEQFKLMITHGVDDKLPYPYRDQDILNIVCKDRVKHIDLEYNFMSNFADLIKEKIGQNAVKSPKIIHYAMEKPWEYSYNAFAAKWWEYAHEVAILSAKSEIFSKVHPKHAHQIKF